MSDGSLILLDARDASRYAGENEPIDAKAGHIPGALNRPFGDNLDDQGQFLPAEDLAGQLDRVIADGGELAVMCGSGVTACHNLFAMELTGQFSDPNNMPALYCGSWSEWIRSDLRPVATGPKP